MFEGTSKNVWGMIGRCLGPDPKWPPGPELTLVNSNKTYLAHVNLLQNNLFCIISFNSNLINEFVILHTFSQHYISFVQLVKSSQRNKSWSLFLDCLISIKLHVIKFYGWNFECHDSCRMTSMCITAFAGKLLTHIVIKI